MKILGIGNAIVDVICRVDDNFLNDHQLIKSTMKLIDENEFQKLLKTLKIEKTIAGGSVANTMVGLAALNNHVGFIGKINDDDLGQKYEESLKIENVKYCYDKKKEILPTGTCLILITPDSERTMCTFLGTAGKISEKDINEKNLKQSEIIFLEGYLWDKGEPQKAFEKALSLSKKSSMTLSDKFCVERHKKEFYELVRNKLDIVFANEQEINELINTKSFREIIEFGKKLNKLLVITRSEKGSIAIKGDEVIECESQKNIKIVDLTGAGDLFAAGFFNGYLNKKTIKESLINGTEMASKIIQRIGARLN
jgi:sugar/nucleoside kinase (ribokinase family)